MIKPRSLSALLLALISAPSWGSCDYEDFPRMDAMLVGIVADGMRWNNNAMNVRSFRVPATTQQVKDFYAKHWKDAVDFTTFGPWQQILHINKDCMMMVQVQAQNERFSFGRLLLTNPPAAGASDQPLGAGVPMPAGAQVVSDMPSDDPLRPGRLTLLLVADDIHRTRAWYESEMLQRGWQLEHRSTLAGSVVLNYAKGRELLSIGMLRHETNTQVLLTRMDQ